LAGGGAALLYASKELDKLQTANFDQKIGVQIIQNALKVCPSSCVSMCMSMPGYLSLNLGASLKIHALYNFVHSQASNIPTFM